MTTALQLVTSSLRKLGAVAAGESLDADEQSDALAALNQIVESWNLKGLALFRRENAAYTLVPSQQEYSVGSGADFDGARPITLHSAFVTRGGIDYPLAVLTQAQWNDILQKSTQSEIPEGIYYDPTFPAGTMRFWPVPIEALTVTLAIDMQLAAVADINDDLAFPPGYERALLYALAVDLAPEYPAVTLSQSVIETADDALADIKRANNTQQQPATFDFALAGGYGNVSMARFMSWV
jgi:hypothetical protein